jgi:hypothetical protein
VQNHHIVASCDRVAKVSGGTLAALPHVQLSNSKGWYWRQPPLPKRASARHSYALLSHTNYGRSTASGILQLAADLPFCSRCYSLVVQDLIRMLPAVMRCEKSASVPKLSSHLWNMQLSWPDTGVENRPWPVTSLQLLRHQIFSPHSLFLLVYINNRKDTRSLELYFYIVPKRFQGIPNMGGSYRS